MNKFIIFILFYLFFIKKEKERFKIIDTNVAKKLIEKKYIKTILDVRTDKEWIKGHYINANHIPIEPLNKIT